MQITVACYCHAGLRRCCRGAAAVLAQRKVSGLRGCSSRQLPGSFRGASCHPRGSAWLHSGAGFSLSAGKSGQATAQQAHAARALLCAPSAAKRLGSRADSSLSHASGSRSCRRWVQVGCNNFCWCASLLAPFQLHGAANAGRSCGAAALCPTSIPPLSASMSAPAVAPEASERRCSCKVPPPLTTNSQDQPHMLTAGRCDAGAAACRGCRQAPALPAVHLGGWHGVAGCPGGLRTRRAQPVLVLRPRPARVPLPHPGMRGFVYFVRGFLPV